PEEEKTQPERESTGQQVRPGPAEARSRTVGEVADDGVIHPIPDPSDRQGQARERGVEHDDVGIEEQQKVEYRRAVDGDDDLTDAVADLHATRDLGREWWSKLDGWSRSGGL